MQAVVSTDNQLNNIRSLEDKFWLKGNKAFVPDDLNAMWLVQEGKVEIFAVQLKNGEPDGTRQHLFSVEKSQALFGFEPDTSITLLAVAVQDSQLVKVFNPFGGGEGSFKGIAQLLDTWVSNLTTTMTKNTLTIETQLILEPDIELTVEPKQRAGLNKTNLWVRFLEGSALFLGEEELSPEISSAYFPCYRNTWFEALAPCRIIAYDIETVVDSAEVLQSLAVFYKVFFQFVSTNLRLETYDEINRLRKKAEYDIAINHQALTSIASVVNHDKALPEIIEYNARNLLLNACKLVGQAQGIVISEPPVAQSEQASKRNALDEILQFSHVRHRLVTLEPNWWTKDNGPLLAFKIKDSLPVAILPISSKAYIVVDPANNKRERVTAEVARTFGASAFIFYRPFPTRALTGWDVFKFGIRGLSKDWLIVALLAALMGLISLIVPIVTGAVFDTIVPSGQQAQLLEVLIVLVVFALSTAAFQVTRAVAILRVESKIDISIQAALWDRLLDLPVIFFRKFSAGDLASRAMGIDNIRRLVGSSVTTSILGSVSSIFSLFLLFRYDIGLALVAVLLTFIALATIISVNIWDVHYQHKMLEVQGKVSSLLLQMINGIAKLRVAGAEVRAFSVWAKQFTGQREWTFKARSVSIIQLIFNAVWPIVSIMVIFASVDLLNARNISTGNFLAFLTAFTQFFTAMINMAVAFISISAAVPLYERAKPIFQAVPEVSTNKTDPGELSGAIEINHVSFRYTPDTPLVLDDVSLKVEAGQFVAIVGPSGAGKSSLIRLLLGFDATEAGSIYYDNQELDSLNVQAVRRQIGVVIQDGKLMSGNIFSNIVGSALYTMDDAWDAARAAGIESDIRQMPMNMHTVVPEGGGTLSGGQKQRIVIARAIVGKPRIMFLDEATSALDNQTQALVSESLIKLQATRLVIAHRLSTIEKADYIYVMEKGKVVQEGTYSDLLQAPGLFQELAARQLA